MTTRKFIILFILLSSILSICLYYSYIKFNNEFRTLKDYKRLESSVTNFYFSKSLHSKAMTTSDHDLVIVLDNTQRIALLKDKYKSYVDSVYQCLGKGVQLRIYMTGIREILVLEDSAYENGSRPYNFYFIDPKQIELECTRYIPKPSSDPGTVNLSEEEMNIALVNGDSSVLAYAEPALSSKVVLPEEYFRRQNRNRGSLMLFLGMIALFFLILTLSSYLRHRKEKCLIIPITLNRYAKVI